MGYVVATGGGEYDRGETEAIERLAMSLTGKEHPRLLFIPTASADDKNYTKSFGEYMLSLGCSSYDSLEVINPVLDDGEIAARIEVADIIYAGGGDALMLMEHWKRRGVDRLLREAYKKGKVLAGISAGSICWFAVGHTDSLSYYSEDWDYKRMDGIGIIPAIHSPHYNEHRRQSLEKWMQNETLPAVGLENNSALVYSDSECRLFCSSPDAHAYLLRHEGGEVITQKYSHNEKVKL